MTINKSITRILRQHEKAKLPLSSNNLGRFPRLTVSPSHGEMSEINETMRQRTCFSQFKKADYDDLCHFNEGAQRTTSKTTRYVH